jgi:murein DD-endopeptidase MepM/ murein hydrolase activator NlpD
MATSRKRNVEIDVVVDDKQAKAKLKGIGDSAEQSGKGFGQLANLAKIGLATLAGSEMVQAIGKLDELGTSMEATDRRASQVFDNLTEAARTWADEQNEAFGLGESATLALAASIQDLLVPMGFARGEAFDMTKTIAEVANATSEWEGGNISAEDATLRFIKAITGEREGLKELGIVISEADVKARLLEKGQQDLTGEALKQAKAQVTLELIMENSADALGAYADRAGSALAIDKELNAETADLAETWAGRLKPAFDDAKSLFTDLAGLAGHLSEQILEATGSSEGFAAQLFDAQTPFKTSSALIGSIADSMLEADDAAGPLTSKTAELSRQMDIARHRTDEARDAIEGFSDTTAEAADPALKFLGALERYDDAQAAYNEAVGKFGPKSAEAETAALKLASAQGILNSAVAEFAETGGKQSIDALIAILTQAGVARDTIDQIVDAIGRLNSTPVTNRFITDKFGNVTGRNIGGRPAFHSGGVVPGSPGEDVPILAQAGETVIPAGGGARPGVTIIVQGSVVAERELMDLVRKNFVRDGRSGRSWT